jgi:hypothetical protein
MIENYPIWKLGKINNQATYRNWYYHVYFKAVMEKGKDVHKGYIESEVVSKHWLMYALNCTMNL